MSPTSSLRPTGRILLAEPDRALLSTMIETLLRDGHGVDAATNGAVALEHAMTRRYDVIVFDTNMPVTDSATLVEELRVLVRPTPVLVGLSDAADAAAWCQGMGIPLFLARPFDAATLRRAIEAALSIAADARMQRTAVPPKSGTHAVTRPACVVAVGGDDASVRDELPESLRDARVVLVSTAAEAEHVLDAIVPDLLVVDDHDQHDQLRDLATMRAVPVLTRGAKAPETRRTRMA